MMEDRNVTTKESNIEDPTEFLLAEYSALREEILQRIEVKHQLVSLALIGAGTMLTCINSLQSFTFTQPSPAATADPYPPAPPETRAAGNSAIDCPQPAE